MRRRKARLIALPCVVILGGIAALLLNRPKVVPIHDTDAWIPVLESGGAITLETQRQDKSGSDTVRRTRLTSKGPLPDSQVERLAATWTRAAKDARAKLEGTPNPSDSDPVIQLEHALEQARLMVGTERFRIGADMLRQGEYIVLDVGKSPPELGTHDLMSISPVTLEGHETPSKVSVYLPLEGELAKLHEYAREVHAELEVAICDRFNRRPAEERRARFERARDARATLDGVQKGESGVSNKQQRQLQEALLDPRVLHDPVHYKYVPRSR